MGLMDDVSKSAVDILKKHLTPTEKERIRQDIKLYGDEWIHRGGLGHFAFGMYIRNMLRDMGISDYLVPTQNLDDYYVEWLERASDE